MGLFSWPAGFPWTSTGYTKPESEDERRPDGRVRLSRWRSGAAQAERREAGPVGRFASFVYARGRRKLVFVLRVRFRLFVVRARGAGIFLSFLFVSPPQDPGRKRRMLRAHFRDIADPLR